VARSLGRCNRRPCNRRPCNRRPCQPAALRPTQVRHGPGGGAQVGPGSVVDGLGAWSRGPDRSARPRVGRVGAGPPARHPERDGRRRLRRSGWGCARPRAVPASSDSTSGERKAPSTRAWALGVTWRRASREPSRGRSAMPCASTWSGSMTRWHSAPQGQLCVVIAGHSANGLVARGSIGVRRAHISPAPGLDRDKVG
jgi:hypothetical protein